MNNTPHRVSAVRRVRHLTGCIAVVLALLSSTSWAQTRDDLKGMSQDANSYFVPAKPVGISAEQATAIVREHTGGRVLSTNSRQVGQFMHYRVRVLVNGERVVTLTVDQRGRINRR
ncbi:MAG: hypothetical protein AAF513_11675 [Pseudomonadota bacterium]